MATDCWIECKKYHTVSFGTNKLIDRNYTYEIVDENNQLTDFERHDKAKELKIWFDEGLTFKDI